MAIRRSRAVVPYGLLLGLIFGLAACGGSDSTSSSSGSSDSASGGSAGSYIIWNGNSNGEWVLDATNDQVRFRTDTRQMVAGSTTYTNTYVDHSANFYIGSSVKGAVVGAAGQSGGTVAVIQCLNGQVIDLYGYTSNLTYTCSSGVYPASLAPLGEAFSAPQTAAADQALEPLAGAAAPPNLQDLDGPATAELAPQG